MIKAVFFDWFNTLAIYYPPREELQSHAIRENGFNITPEKIRLALLKADKLLFEENAVSPVRLRTPKEQTRVYNQYEETILREVGIDISANPGLAAVIYRTANKLYRKIGFRLFDDVIPVFQELKKRKLVIGLITNLEIDMKPICNELGLSSYLDFIVTSGEAGSDKPQPAIFKLALKKAGVDASQAVHIGDQYKSDAVGAMGVGIKPVVIDRFDMYPEITDCPRIKSLFEIYDFIKVY